MKETKRYSGDIKRSAVELHLNSHFGYKKVANMLGIPSATSVRKWTITYQTKGPEALYDKKTRNRSDANSSSRKGMRHKAYSKELKRYAIELHFNSHYGYKKIAKMLGVSSPHSIKEWIRVYQEEGPEAIDNIHLGGHKRRRPAQFPKPKESHNKSYLEELEWLRAENAYLKKLEALVASKENRKPRL